MLSRSNSAANERLRRAKSTSSTHTSSSGHHRSSTQTDPFVTRQQAEAAAVEAYNRARQLEEPAYQAYRAVPPRLERRKSNVTGRPEGSHFEDARLGRRRPTAIRENSSKARPTPVDVRRDRGRNIALSEGQTVVTRKRSVIEPLTSSSSVAALNTLSVPTTTRHVRRTPSAYMDGSPVPRESQQVRKPSSILLSRTPTRVVDDGYNGHLSKLSDFGAIRDEKLESFSLPQHGTRVDQIDEQAVAMARDRCLLDFQQKRVRERKSFIFAPVQKLQKRAITAMHKSSPAKCDSAIPPSNHANDYSVPVPPPPLPDLVVPAAAAALKHAKTRNFSDSMKGRIKKMFRKPSRAPSGLPAQHVEAKKLHYPVEEHHNIRGVQLRDGSDPFKSFSSVTPSIEDTPAENLLDSVRSRFSIADDDTARSRVTSWTNSTVAGTVTSHAGSEHMQVATEHGALKRSDSVSTLRRKSSVLGRSISNRLRRPSKAELRSSEESQRLYSALQEKIGSPVHEGNTSMQVAIDGSPAPERRSALDTLPSRQSLPAVHGNPYGWRAPTIRSVTPDPSAYKLMSPVVEVPSPDAAQGAERTPTNLDLPRSRPEHRAELKTAPASQEQLARRAERAKNRWQAPLDELSPHPNRANWIEENPYELRSLSRTLSPTIQPVQANSLPHHVRANQDIAHSRTNILSPSLYSRATDGASPRPDTPVDEGPMLVTITSREVKRYSLSPPKMAEQTTERPIRGSKDWRKWLSDETRAFEASPGPDDLALPDSVLSESKATEVHVTKIIADQYRTTIQARPTLNMEQRPVSKSRSPDAVPPVPEAARPRAVSRRRSSFMNERYPMVESTRQTSSESVPTTRKSSSQVGDRLSSGEQKSDVSSTARHSIINRRRPVPTYRKSIANMESATKPALAGGESTNEQSIASKTTALTARPILTTAATAPSAPVTSKTSSRPRSAFDLRANYRSRAANTARPLEVRRQAMAQSSSNHILDDTMVRNISAGPYASQATISSSILENKENTPPPASPALPDDEGLPALSSSQWLAGPTSKKRDSGNARQPNAYIDAANSSPAIASYYACSPDGSPGQRMAAQWLQGRGGSKENSPAFV